MTEPAQKIHGIGNMGQRCYDDEGLPAGIPETKLSTPT